MASCASPAPLSHLVIDFVAVQILKQRNNRFFLDNEEPMNEFEIQTTRNSLVLTYPPEEVEKILEHIDLLTEPSDDDVEYAGDEEETAQDQQAMDDAEDFEFKEAQSQARQWGDLQRGLQLPQQLTSIFSELPTIF